MFTSGWNEREVKRWSMNDGAAIWWGWLLTAWSVVCYVQLNCLSVSFRFNLHCKFERSGGLAESTVNRWVRWSEAHGWLQQVLHTHEASKQYREVRGNLFKSPATTVERLDYLLLLVMRGEIYKLVYFPSAIGLHLLDLECMKNGWCKT